MGVIFDVFSDAEEHGRQEKSVKDCECSFIERTYDAMSRKVFQKKISIERVEIPV